MIEELRITSLGVIDTSALEPGPGLTVLTGETGAGKTMVVTALGLLLGNRADSGAVRAGARQARVEGVIRADSLPGLSSDVLEAGGDVDENQVLLSRTVAAHGRSRAFAGGAGVPVSVLSALTEPLVAVHGQSDQHRLLRTDAQRAALDRFGGARLAEVRECYRSRYAALVETEQQLEEVTSHVRERAREAEQLRQATEEIAAVAPTPGEDEALVAEESRLGSADTLRTAAGQARDALSSDDDHPDALGAAGAARSALEGVRSYDPEAAALADRVTEISHLLADASADVASYADGVEADPARLAAVSERRAALTSLTRKYGETLEEVLAWAEEATRRLAELDSTDDTVARLAAERDRLRAEIAEHGAALSEARADAAGELSRTVTAELERLAMPHATLMVSVHQSEVDPHVTPAAEPLSVGERLLRWGSDGLDEVEFLLDADGEGEGRPLAKTASGGELSRVMLALEVALAATDPVPTFVFDEVDAGVGGRAAVEVGRRLAALARHAQVLVVTHLPQVAAYADRHVVVRKDREGAVTSAGLAVVEEQDRERELSRMLAGMDHSANARAHARELLDAAEPERAGG